MLESLFNKVACLKACNFTKKRLQHRCFPVNIAIQIFKNTYFEEHMRTVASDYRRFASLYVCVCVRVCGSVNFSTLYDISGFALRIFSKLNSMTGEK